MARYLAFAVAFVLAACGGAAGDPRTPRPQPAPGEPPPAGADPDDPCERARLLEHDCLERLGAACGGEDLPACHDICYPFVIQVRELCPDVDKTECHDRAERAWACLDEASAACASLREGLEACEAHADEVCRPLRESPEGRDDPELIRACDEATAACWPVFTAHAKCRAQFACDEKVKEASQACGGA